MKTEYRIISDGYKDFLEYKVVVVYKLFFLFKRSYEYWEYVPNGNWDYLYVMKERLTSYQTNLTKWVENHPDISEYLDEVEVKIKNQHKRRDEESAKIENRKKEVKYL